jgi:microcystin degradation protein MlrC
MACSLGSNVSARLPSVSDVIDNPGAGGGGDGRHTGVKERERGEEERRRRMSVVMIERNKRPRQEPSSL